MYPKRQISYKEHSGYEYGNNGVSFGHPDRVTSAKRAEAYPWSREIVSRGSQCQVSVRSDRSIVQYHHLIPSVRPSVRAYSVRKHYNSLAQFFPLAVWVSTCQSEQAFK